MPGTAALVKLHGSDGLPPDRRLWAVSDCQHGLQSDRLAATPQVSLEPTITDAAHCSNFRFQKGKIGLHDSPINRTQTILP